MGPTKCSRFLQPGFRTLAGDTLIGGYVISWSLRCSNPLTFRSVLAI